MRDSDLDEEEEYIDVEEGGVDYKVEGSGDLGCSVC